MLHLYDRATMALALSRDLEPQLHRLLSARIAALGEELIDWTEYLVVEPGDTEDDIVRHVGFSPLVEPFDGIRFGEPGFHPHWDWLIKHIGWYEMSVSFGSTFAYGIFIQAASGTSPPLLQMCRHYRPT
jgi:hypothetical protein